MKIAVVFLLLVHSLPSHASSNSFIAIDVKQCDLIVLNYATKKRNIEQYGNEMRPIDGTIYGTKDERKITGRCALGPKLGDIPFPSSLSCEGNEEFPLAGKTYIHSSKQWSVYRCKTPCGSEPTTVYWVGQYSHVDKAFFNEHEEAQRRCPGFADLPYLQTGP